MVPKIATFFCLIFIASLFWKDRKQADRPSAAIWIPLFWMFLAGSRWVSSWLGVEVSMESANDYAEGSPVDRAVFFSLIVAGVCVLISRKIAWFQLIAVNKLLVCYLLFCLLSLFWADASFIVFKRWIKDLGNPVMALLILTERHPGAAIAFVLRRLAFLLLPLSVLFVKYYPDLGRTFHVDGTQMYTGVGHQKNDLGLMCLTAGIYAFWELLQNKRPGARSTALLLIALLAWLLQLSNSQTSLTCLVVATTVFFVGRMGFIQRQPTRIIGIVVAGALAFALLQGVFDLKASILEWLGRNPSLTNRTEVWSIVKEHEVNALVGAGFMSFWSGARLETIWETLGTPINQAHNGYLEQYLNLGYIGVFFIFALMLKGLFSIRSQLGTAPATGMLRLSFIVTAALYNYTEASFYGMNNMWMLLLLACIDPPPEKEAPKPLYSLSTGVADTAAIPAHEVVYRDSAPAGHPRSSLP